MRSNQHVRAAVGVAVLLISVSAQAARTKIPYSTITAAGALTPGQLRHIESYLDERITQLVDGTEEQIVATRRELIEPLTWAGGTAIFHLAYSSATANRLAEGMKSPRLLVRLNTMIVVNSLNDPGVARLIEKGLADSSPAVRYWAGKAINRSITGRLSNAEQSSLLEALTRAMLRETSERVLQRLLVAVVGLDLPEAATRLLEALNNRVALHAVNPNMPLGAAIEGLRTLFVKMVEAKANDRDAPVATIRKIAIVAYRYFDLSASLLDMDQPSLENHDNYREMIKLDDAILRWTVRQLPPEGGAHIPLSVKGDIAAGNWPLIRLRAEEWKRVLAQAPFRLGPVDLMVTLPDPP